jgi:FkbM family methyltransferase
MRKVDLTRFIEKTELIDSGHFQDSELNLSTSHEIFHSFETIDGLTPGSVFVVDFGSVSIKVRYIKFGVIDIKSLFNFNELMILSFYLRNSHRYTNFIDIGANVGVHSLFALKCGLAIKSFEPDPEIFAELEKNILLNHGEAKSAVNAAISSHTGNLTFTRVLNNRTASGIDGKKDYYGPIENFSVKTLNIDSILKPSSLIKIDAEGSEADIISDMNFNKHRSCDFILEIGTKANAIQIYDFVKQNSKIKIFSQNLLWKEVESFDQMPHSRHDGTLFLSHNFSFI